MQNGHLETCLSKRPEQLIEAKNRGIKIVGYFPGNYVPEEMIVASGAIPVCLINGGDTQPVEAASKIMPSLFCPFARAQVGEKVLRKNTFYSLIDLLVAPITCQHLKKAAEIMEYQGDIQIFKLGIPHQFKNDYEVNYYAERLSVLKEKLRSLTGITATEETINRAIDKYNNLRSLLRQISLARRSSSPPLNSLDFIKLNHASYVLDYADTIEILKSTLQQVSLPQDNIVESNPRILLMGPNISLGDYKIFDMVNKAGGNIVIEEIFEGIRDYWQNIDNNDNPILSLAEGYLKNRVPPAFMRYSTKKRLDFISKLISEFNISGIIWYELLGCETYDAESYFFSQKMSERNVPMLILESDYVTMDRGPARTRIEAFIEMVKGGLE